MHEASTGLCSLRSALVDRVLASGFASGAPGIHYPGADQTEAMYGGNWNAVVWADWKAGAMCEWAGEDLAFYGGLRAVRLNATAPEDCCSL